MSARPGPRSGSGQRRESKVWPVAGMRAPVVGGTVAGGHIMLAVEMRACAVGETGGCKPGRRGSVRPHQLASTDSSDIQTLPGDSCYSIL